MHALDPASEVLPVLGSREALFAFGQAVIDGSRVGATVVVPNPFYQIYEGAALLAGAAIHCVNADAGAGFAHRFGDVPPDVWARTQLLYVCSPDNPTGRVMAQDEWQALFALSDRYGFVKLFTPDLIVSIRYQPALGPFSVTSTRCFRPIATR